MPEIKIKNLNFSYKAKKKALVPVLKDLNVVFLNNKINVIAGPSGCGKTTLLKTILGLVNYEGDIYFDDKHHGIIRKSDTASNNISLQCNPAQYK